MDENKKWLTKARAELRAAEYNFSGGEFETSAFLSQQAAEKALKACYIKKFRELKKTHDLVALARELELPKQLVDRCKELSPAYVYTRYPDVVEIKDIKETAKNLLKYAKEVVEWSEKT